MKTLTGQTRAAIDAGATVSTHLFNAMRPIHHREPGPVIALLAGSWVTVKMITGGAHVDGALYRHVVRSASPSRMSLITDAMATTGMSDETCRMGSLDVEVARRVATLSDTHTIAGSSAGIDRVFRFAVVSRCSTTDCRARMP